ncbi:DUF5123 domain-containing protein [Wenyingzhuangia sp. IMCC45467]
MKNLKRFTHILSFFLAFVSLGMLNACQEDEFIYNKIDNLFQPKFVLDEPLVESNSIALVWYRVNEASSYTVELFTDNYYKDLFESYETTETQILMDDIPYKTQFYIRIRSNHKEEKNNSEWAYSSALTEERPPYAQILNRVEKVNITETDVKVTWAVDVNNPVDSISVAPAIDKELPAIGRSLNQDEITLGEATITGLEKNTLYNVNVFDNNKSRRYDKPYNQETFRSAGPSAATILVNRGMNLDSLLMANNLDPDVPEGTEYLLESGSLFKITPFSVNKGFKLVGSTQGERPQIEMNGNWNIAEGSYIASLAFENIRFYQTLEYGYFFNSGNSWTLEEISIYNCVFNHFMRGFWRHQGGGKYKEIGSFNMSYSTLDEVGGHTGPYGTFAINSGGADNIKSAIFSNCTFMRDHYKTADETRNFRNLFDYGSSEYPIHLEYQNITIYDYAYNQGLINIPAAEGSTLIFKNVLLASASGKVIRGIAANTTTAFENNYTTTDYLLGASDIEGTALTISANELFTDPTNGDLTIQDTNSPVVTNQVGDTRWLP